jgi:protein-disulfide isomerase
MSTIKNNIWGIGFVVVLGGALVAMALANKSSNIPSPTGTAKDTATFTITTSDNIKGSSDAKVTFVEFSDFQCPACKAYAPVLNALVDVYPNDVRVVYKHFPLKTIHYRAQAGAQAAQAAALQGKFWEMSKVLFENQEVWSKQTGTETFEKYAGDLGMDVSKFKQDYGSDAVKAKIDSDIKEGIDLNVNGTPTLYLNGTKIANPSSSDEFKKIIDAEITKLGGTPPTTTVAPQAN